LVLVVTGAVVYFLVSIASGGLSCQRLRKMGRGDKVGPL